MSILPNLQVPSERSRSWIVAVLAAATAILSACSGQAVPDLNLPGETIIQARGSAVLVTKPYSRLFSQPDPQSPVLYPVRLGEIGTINSASSGQRLVAGQLDYWYLVSFQDAGREFSGWIFGADVELYATQARAQSASVELSRSGSDGGSVEGSDGGSLGEGRQP